MIPESIVCQGCGVVNPGSLREKGGKVLCEECRENIDERIYELLEYKMRGKGIRFPNNEQVVQAIHVSSSRAGRYLAAWNRRHAEAAPKPKQKGMDAIQHAVKGTNQASPTAELDKALKEQEGKQ